MTIKQLLELDKEIVMLKQIYALLNWDEVVLMPEKSAKERGEQLTLIGLEIHDRLANRMPKLLGAKPRNPMEKKIVERYKWVCERASKIPASFVAERTRALSSSHHAWERARREGDFRIFKPHLEKVVKLKRKEAKYLMPKKRIHPYEVLLQDYEQGMSIAELDKTFAELRLELIRIIKKAKKYPRKRLFISEDIQKDILRKISTMILQDKERFLIAQSVHPFMTTISGNDFRITTAIRDDPFFSISSSAHESGHALYESQFDPKYSGTILADAPSMGIHESQSRIWENQICRSENFWMFMSKEMAKEHPELKKYSWKDYYMALNRSEASLIRIEADELTYCLHIIIRYELEKQLFEGKIEVKDLPKLWNKKYKEYLGVVPKDDVEGVMQDTHWADGLFGYFPTYALGSIYSAMIYAAMKKDFNVENDVLKGNFERIRSWLKKNIHQYGYFYLTREIIKKVCGTELDIRPFVKYLEKKFD